ncbi:unnamed protein product [Lactuca virosa]|uniref:Sugar phosphate transporter domain-containing protein n=1 Tax=Lactuca virosa TaxID=75947 RepID=A0AAU9MXR9_9ASTR|nr:unnamed protein product [Lactuca virosa]
MSLLVVLPSYLSLGSSLSFPNSEIPQVSISITSSLAQNSLCAFALNLAVFLLVGKTSALTMNVAGVVKDWLLIAFSWSVIKDTVTPINLLGYGIAFLGVAYYNHAKLQALKAKEVEKKATQVDDESGKLLEEKSAEKSSDN